MGRILDPFFFSSSHLLLQVRCQWVYLHFQREGLERRAGVCMVSTMPTGVGAVLTFHRRRII
jgi:hypothetical protein